MDPSSRHSAKEVGDTFAKSYYKTLQYSPELLHGYYNDVSQITRPGLDGTMRSSTLQNMIDDLNMLSSGGFNSVEVTSFKSKETYSGVIRVVADGFFTSHERPGRNFTHRFFLYPQETGYFVLTDMFKFVDTSETNDGAAICVKNLPSDATIAFVEEAFKQFGEIRRGGVEVRNKKSLSYGFVEFKEESAAKAAIEASPVMFEWRSVSLEKKRPDYISYWQTPSSGPGTVYRSEEMSVTKVPDEEALRVSEPEDDTGNGGNEAADSLRLSETEDYTGNENNQDSQALNERSAVHVINLPPNATNDRVENAFKQFGLDGTMRSSTLLDMTERLVAVQSVSINQIPREIIPDIFYRMPKRYHQVVACVSKRFLNFVKSEDLQKERRLLDKDAIYFCFNNGSPNPAWYRLQKSNEKDDVFSEASIVPKDHECTRTLRNIFSCGSEIILVGGQGKKLRPKNEIVDPTKVWIFDSICGRLREAPSLPLELFYRNSALVRDDLYVFGTPLEFHECLRERYQVYGIRFDLLSQTWSRPFKTRMNYSTSTQSVDKNIYLLTSEECVHQVYNISKGVFTSYREPYKSAIGSTTWTMTGVCVFENVFYSYDAEYGLFWYDTKLDKWNAVKGSTMGRIEDFQLGKTWSIALKEYYGKLVLLWTDRDHNPFDPEVIAEDARMTVRYTIIALRRTETEIYGEVEEIRVLGTLPRRYSLGHCVSVLV